jgi:hypothetical protein
LRSEFDRIGSLSSSSKWRIDLSDLDIGILAPGQVRISRPWKFDSEAASK